jgi:hypothetical protein
MFGISRPKLVDELSLFCQAITYWALRWEIIEGSWFSEP